MKNAKADSNAIKADEIRWFSKNWNERADVKRVTDILVVDDAPDNLALLAEMLLQCGYSVRVATNGKMALRSVQAKEPDLILLDICLPDMDGYFVCRCLQSDSKLRHIPVIFLSALSAVEEKTKAFGCGGVDYITKPFSMSEMQSRITVQLRFRQLQKNMLEQESQLRVLSQEYLKQIADKELASIFALAKLAEIRDASSGDHLGHVRVICRILSEGLKAIRTYRQTVSDDFVDCIFHTSALHDIGKIAISDAVLLKPEKLTSEEFETIKTHTVIGHKILGEIYNLLPNHLLAMAKTVARSHHERWDGSGYPDGLAGEEIPLCARIMGLVDVYDAIRSKRCYKNAMPHAAACSYIVNSCGKQFDPHLVEVFLNLQDEVDKVY
jgi:putative two-component system response regulator